MFRRRRDGNRLIIFYIFTVHTFLGRRWNGGKSLETSLCAVAMDVGRLFEFMLGKKLSSPKVSDYNFDSVLLEMPRLLFAHCPLSHSGVMIL